jgi:murein DD-endopeptidase MepM/ murein hydrolase activator NlpD
MRRHYFKFRGICALAVLFAGATSGTGRAGDVSVSPTLRVEPARARPGDALLLTVLGVPTADMGSVSATVAGRRVRFFPVQGGAQAVAALPVELEPTTLDIEVRVGGAATSGTAAGSAAAATSATPAAPAGTVTLRAQVEVVPPHFPETRLSVEPKFIAPSPAERKRMEADQAAFREAFGRPFEVPRFDGPFTHPRDAATTGQFGELRTFNGKKQSQHYGTDLAGAVGDPVRTSNDGVVVLVRDCFASGKSIAVAHGGGLFTVYFHLSDFAVRSGDRVRRGDRIGLVGKTGRATGPHLHFGVKIGDLYVDPESVYRLAFAPPTSGTAGGTAGTVGEGSSGTAGGTPTR